MLTQVARAPELWTPNFDGNSSRIDICRELKLVFGADLGKHSAMLFEMMLEAAKKAAFARIETFLDTHMKDQENIRALVREPRLATVATAAKEFASKNDALSLPWEQRACVCWRWVAGVAFC
eukprot:2363772-Pleurochrysis_carterae.AAC.1